MPAETVSVAVPPLTMVRLPLTSTTGPPLSAGMAPVRCCPDCPPIEAEVTKSWRLAEAAARSRRKRRGGCRFHTRAPAKDVAIINAAIRRVLCLTGLPSQSNLADGPLPVPTQEYRPRRGSA